MCMEDIRIGRASHNTPYVGTTSAGSSISICPPSKNRIALTFSAQLAATGNICLVPRGYPVGSGIGWILRQNVPNLVIRVEEVGQAIWQEWLAFDVLGSNILFCTSTELAKE